MNVSKMFYRPSAIKWSASVLLNTPQGIVVVTDPERAKPIPKFPGGKWEPQDGNDPQSTASRELLEETGLRSITTLQLVTSRIGIRARTRESYTWYLYAGICHDLSTLLERGEGGETISFLKPEDLSYPERFLFKHWQPLADALCEGQFQLPKI